MEKVILIICLSFCLVSFLPNAQASAEETSNDILEEYLSSEAISSEEESSEPDPDVEGEGYLEDVAEWTNKISDNLGFLKQTVSMFYDLVDIITSAEASNTFTIPEFKIMGYTIIEKQEFEIIHEKMENAISVIRIITDSVVIIFAINMAVTYYNKFFGGEK